MKKIAASINHSLYRSKGVNLIKLCRVKMACVLLLVCNIRILFVYNLNGMEPSSRKRAISCGMTALSSTAVHGRHMQSTGALVTTLVAEK